MPIEYTLDDPAANYLLGDCLEKLESLPPESIDAVVTDPPYGLGSKEPTVEDIIKYLSGDSLDTGGDFMGKAWEIPPVAVWKQCFRVLKPGGHLFSFGGTRTWDLISLGIRAAGFDNRDTIASHFGPLSVLSWVHGQGFPKSMNVFKQVVKLFEKKIHDGGAKGKILWAHDGAQTSAPGEVVSFTLYEREFQLLHHEGNTFSLPQDVLNLKGYGTALKPSWEPILVFRKPVEGSLTKSIVDHGTSALNIDASRVKHANASDLAAHKAMVDALKAKGGSLGNSWKNSSDLSGANEVSTAGRWPANVVLLHSSECRQVGTTKVNAPVINRFEDGMKPFGEGAGHAYVSTQTGDAEGKEEVGVWECAEGCPVRLLDGQSGGARPEKNGASRFFVQALPEAPFFYAGKASRREKNEGVRQIKLQKKALFLREDLTDEECEALAVAWEDFDPEREKYEKEEVPKEVQKYFEAKDKIGNVHPCLHPDALVLTENGYRPIQSVEIGNRVYTAEGTFQPVSHVTRHPYTSPNLFEIHVMNTNLPVMASDNHPFLIWRPVRTAKGGISGGEVLWLRADNIRKGDYTMSPKLKESFSSDLPNDPALWFMFGLYLAEGSLQSAGHGANKYPSFSLCADELDLIEKIQDFFGSERVSVYKKPESNGVQVLAFSPEHGELFEEWGGRHSHNKSISPKLWSLNPSLHKAVLDGWMAGDGGRVRQHDQGKTVSMSLAAHIRVLAESSGLRCRIYRTDPVEDTGIGDRKFKSTRPCYQLDVTEGIDRSGPRWVEHEGTSYSLHYVTEVVEVPYVGDVVNLSVEGNPTFQTSVGMSHNTVKPVKLMEWLVTLATPKGGTILDPYAGSGTTCVAAVKQRLNFVGIERDALYHEIGQSRIRHTGYEKKKPDSEGILEDLMAEIGE